MSESTAPSGRGWAYTGAILGGLVSVAANVAHSYIPPAAAPAGWHPEPGAVFFAVVWPVFLFIAIEILARSAWPTGAGWSLLRFGGMVPVAAVAAFVSYRHLSGLLAHYGEVPIVYHLGPLAVDGLMVMATGALLATSTRRTSTPATPATPAPAVALPVPPAAVPVAQAPAKRAPAKKASPAKKATPTVPTPPRKRVPAPVSTYAPPVSESAAPPATPAPLVPTAPAPAPATPTADTHVAPVDVATPLALPVPAAMLTRARHVAAAHLAATNTPITVNELAVRMHVNSALAAQVLAVLNLPDQPPAIARANGTPVGART